MSVYQVNQYIKHRLSAKNKGFGVHSPFVFDLINNVIENEDTFYKFKEIEKLRRDLLLNDNEIDILDLGAGSKKFKTSKRKISDIAKYSLKPRKQAEFIFRLANYFKSKNIIELGTSLGTTTMYLSLTSKEANIYTIEGDKNIYKIANESFNKLGLENIYSYLGNFNNELPKLLKTIDTVDMAFVDGNHTKQYTIEYFKMLKQKIHKDSIIVFDDIYWSKQMTEAWEIIKKDKSVKISIDLFHLGIVFFREDIPKQDFKLFSNNL